MKRSAGLGGGTTPSMGLVYNIQKACPGVPLMVSTASNALHPSSGVTGHALRKAMVRPRTGDFCYSQAELEVMEQDIDTFKSTGVFGVVFGVLTSNAEVDVAGTRK